MRVALLRIWIIVEANAQGLCQAIAGRSCSQYDQKSKGSADPARWRLQDAKARFSELVRTVRSDGPQHVTVHGRDEVVVISADEFRWLTGGQTGQTLILALQASPHRDVEVEHERMPMPVRDVIL